MTEAKFDDYRSLKASLEKALAECQRLREENAQLKFRLGITPETIVQATGQLFEDNIEQVQETNTNINVTKYSAPEKKIHLFRSLFRGREDVYPVRWEGKAGKKGYSPACANEWKDGYCQKPRVKCSHCSNRYFLPVTDELIQKHLTGKCTIGVYPLLPDETCCFLAVDFDKQNWPDDARAFLDTCDQLGVPAAMERSRSGNGAHIWIFFDEPVPAARARALGSYILTQTMEIRPELGFNSYDRFFPNQDTIPRGGFGNLIALPLQYKPRQKGNSVFVNHQYRAYDDQWAYLASIKKINSTTLDSILKEAYVLGLTATPIRKDGHHPIIIMQCGPIRFRVDDRQQAAIRPFDHVVIPRTTQFVLSDNYDVSMMHEVYAALAVDEGRNDLIFDDILHALDEGRSPIILTERNSHLDYLAQRLEGFAKNIIVLRGGMGKKQRQALADRIISIPDHEERVLLATGRYIGEGFDDARLDTLFLVMPISWKGTLQQYAGRLHRLHHNKHEVQIYDYLDINVPLLNRMYDKRLQGYRNMGYEIRIAK